MASGPAQALLYLAAAYAAGMVLPHRGVEIGLAVLAGFALTAPVRIVFAGNALAEVVSCLFGAVVLYVTLVFALRAAGAPLGERSLAFAFFVPAFPAVVAVAILTRLVVRWRTFRTPKP